MKPLRTAPLPVALTLLLAAGSACADDNFWIGAKAGTLGLGLEAMWKPAPFVDLRAGVNSFDYELDSARTTLDYDVELQLDNYYGTANFRVPLNPMRFTVGVFSNGNELALISPAQSGTVVIGGVPLPGAAVGELRGDIAFQSTSPYAGIGFDFRAFGAAGISIDLGVLWQDSPLVQLSADGPITNDPIAGPAFQAAMDIERRELEDEFRNYKAYPVASIGIHFNF